jgi:protein-tyrosine-phosphatase
LNILYVCTGNTCRSPLAEGITRAIAAERGLTDISVRSAGTNANDGSSASDGSLLVGLENGIDLNTHRSQLLTPELVHWADLILTMGGHHLQHAEMLGGEGKTHLLTSFASRGENTRPVNDPFGGDLPIYRATFQELSQQIDDVLDRVTSDRR